MLTSDAVLAHYDTKKQLKPSCDASQYGLGAVLSVINSEEHPIAFSSRELSKAKRNYKQVEEEALAKVPQICIWQIIHSGYRPQAPFVCL